jgi:hypothetical protein
MRLSTLTLIALQMLYQSINAGGDWESLQNVLAQKDKAEALLFVKADPKLTELVELHFVIMNAFKVPHNKQAAMWLTADLESIHNQMKSHLSKEFINNSK